MILSVLLAMFMHPGHMTRIEIRASDDSAVLEIAMRMDIADLEAALKRRTKQVIDVDTLSEKDAQVMIGAYLSETIRIGSDKPAKTPLTWLGLEKHPRHLWIFFELPIAKSPPASVSLVVNTLMEVEPEIQHVIVLDDNVGDRTIVVSGPDKAVAVPTSAID
jgi:hypothetical protein